MKILVFGAGAIGMAFGGFLSRRHQVTLLGRAAHLRAIQEKGLRVDGIWGRHTFRNLRTAETLTELKENSTDFDLILICVKSYDTARAARELRKILKGREWIVSLQNGLGNIEILHRYLPPGQVLAARVIFGVEVRGPGRIRVTVIAKPTAVGETAKRKRTYRTRKIARIFHESGLPAAATSRVESLLWAKVIYNSALNPLASLLGCRYGNLGRREWTRCIMDAVISEIYAVARRKGVTLEPAAEDKYRRLFYGRLLPSTYYHHPSMLQDLRAGKRTEIDALNGAIVKIARSLKVKVPVNRFLVKAIKEKEKAA